MGLESLFCHQGSFGWLLVNPNHMFFISTVFIFFLNGVNHSLVTRGAVQDMVPCFENIASSKSTLRTWCVLVHTAPHAPRRCLMNLESWKNSVGRYCYKRFCLCVYTHTRAYERICCETLQSGGFGTSSCSAVVAVGGFVWTREPTRPFSF